MKTFKKFLPDLIIYSVFLLMIFFFTSCINRYFEPCEVPNSVKISYPSFVIFFDTVNFIPSVASYILKYDPNAIKHRRTDIFINDPNFVFIDNPNRIYLRSGFDRGHNIPAEDFSHDLSDLRVTFLYTNIFPQTPKFNRGIWKKLEAHLRKISERERFLLINSGSFVTDSSKFFYNSKIKIPDYFFKTALWNDSNDYQGIAFFIPHYPESNNIFDYVITIDSLESITSINFYCKIPESIQQNFESTFDLKFWKF